LGVTWVLFCANLIGVDRLQLYIARVGLVIDATA